MRHAIEKALRIAHMQVDRNPSEAAKSAGNYAKGHLTYKGLDITIENPKGSQRSGIDRGGKRWSVTMPSSYGYIKNTEGHDGDHVDCYLGSDHDSDKVWIVDQVDAKTKRFDEHKCLLSFASRKDALAAYEKAFSDGKGKDRIGHVTEMSVDAFKDWLRSGDTTKPLRGRYADGGAVDAALAIANRYNPVLAQATKSLGDYLQKPWQPAPGEDFQYEITPDAQRKFDDWVGRHTRHDLPKDQADKLMQQDPDYQRQRRLLWQPRPFNPNP